MNPSSLRRSLPRAALVALAAGAVLLPMAAFAAETSTTDPAGVQTANFILTLVNILLTPFIWLSGWLLSPSWSMGDVIGLRPRLHDMWVLVSNIVYVCFALGLLAVAFVNIFSVAGADSKFQLKAMLPKFVVGLMIVPFSWFAVSAILSMSGFLTASVLQLPHSVIDVKTGNPLSRVFIPKEVVLDFREKKDVNAAPATTPISQFDASNTALNAPAPSLPSPVDAANLSAAQRTGLFNSQADCHAVFSGPTGGFAPKDGLDKCVSVQQALSSNGTYSPILYYAYGVFKIQDNKILREGKVKDLSSVLELGLDVVFNAVFAVVLFVLLFALFAALAVRAIVLWAYVVFSPVFGLMYFLKGSFSFADKIGEKFSFGKFVSLAMTPVYVAAALSFGIIFLNAAQDFSFEKKADGSQSLSDGSTTLEVKGGSAVFSTGEGGVTFRMLGGTNVTEVKRLADTSLGYIIFSSFAMIVLYLAVMAALKANDITAMVVSPIDSLAKTVAKTAPIPGLGGISVSSAQKLSGLGGGQSVFQTALTQTDEARYKKLQGKFLPNMDVATETHLDQVLGQAGEKMNSAYFPDAQKDLMALAKKYGTTNSRFQTRLKDVATRLQKSGELQWSKIDPEKLFYPDGSVTDMGAAVLGRDFNSGLSTSAGLSTQFKKYARATPADAASEKELKQIQVQSVGLQKDPSATDGTKMVDVFVSKFGDAQVASSGDALANTKNFTSEQVRRDIASHLADTNFLTLSKDELLKKFQDARLGKSFTADFSTVEWKELGKHLSYDQASGTIKFVQEKGNFDFAAHFKN